MHFKSTFTTRKQKFKGHGLYILQKHCHSIRQIFIKSCYEPGTILTPTTMIYGVFAAGWIKFFDGLSFSSYEIIL